MNDAYLLIGGNIGDRESFLHKSIESIELHCGKILKKSMVYETQAWGKTDQDPFLNQVLKISTELSPQELLKKILGVEKELGRIRDEKYGARTIDIDILYFGDEIISEAALTIPHPRIAERRFVLIPLAEIAQKFIDPIHQQSIETLLKNCNDKLEVRVYN
jgi:2-amino-4-hydroxy-6-hydroxymethyldihydropteridine diphosphokinase